MLLPTSVFSAELLPGFNLNGSFAYTFTGTRSTETDPEAVLEHVGTLLLQPSTYIYEPWLVQLDGDVRINVTTDSTGYDAQGFTGRLRTSILPYSFFPTSITYTRFNQWWQYEDGFDGAMTGNVIAITQAVRGDGWDLNTFGTIQNASYSSGAADSQNSVTSNFNSQFSDGSPISVTLGFDQAGFSAGEGGGEVESIGARGSVTYTYEPWEDAVVTSTSSVSVSEMLSEDSEYRGFALQGISTGSWRPEGSQDWIMQGALRTYQNLATIETATSTIDQRGGTGFGTLSSSYTLAPRLVLTNGLDLGYAGTTTETKPRNAAAAPAAALKASTEELSAGTSSRLSYASEPEEIGYGVDWSWGADVEVSLLGSNEGAFHREGAGLDQLLSKEFDLPLVGTVRAGFRQGLDASYGNVGEVLIPISHSLTLSSNPNLDGDHWDMWHASFSDNRVIGGDAYAYQLLNLQYTRGYLIDAYTEVTGGLTFQLSKFSSNLQASPVADDYGWEDAGWEDTTAGNVGFSARRLFGLDGLSFSTEYAINPRSFLSAGRFGLVEEDISGFARHRVTSRLTFGLGKLSVGVVGQVSFDGDTRDEMVVFQLLRKMF